MIRGTPSPLRRFADFEVNVELGELRRYGHRIKLQEKPFQILAALLEHPGALVSREELYQRLWSNDTFVDFDHNLNNAVDKLRKALNDSAEKPKFVETVPRRGYRFVAGVERYESPKSLQTQEVACTLEIGLENTTSTPPPILNTAPPQPVSSAPSAASPSNVAPRFYNRYGRFSTIGLTALLLFAVVGTSYKLRGWFGDKLVSSSTRPADTTVPTPVRVAVLPFHNASHSSGAEDLSAGIVDELIGTLGHVPGNTLRVLAEGSCLQYRETTKTPSEIAQALRVQYLIVGSVTNGSDRAEVKVQLVNGLNQEVLWASSYTGPVSQVRSEVADSVAREIQVNLLPDSAVTAQVGGTSNRLAHESYLRGKLDIERKNYESSHRALREFHNATVLDPKYALAYAGLSEIYINFANNEPTGPSYASAKEASRTAIRLDDRVGEAHRDLAWVLDNYDFDWAGAELEYLRALQLNPSDARAHHWYAQHLVAQGKIREALREVRIGLDLDPLSEGSNYNYGFILMFSGQFDAAIDYLKNELLREPNSEVVHGYLGLAFRYKHDYENSILEFRRTVEVSALKQQYEAALAVSLALGGKAEEARRIASRLRRQWERGVWMPAYNLAVMYFALGDKDNGYRFLRLALSQRSCTLLEMNTEPVLLGLRGDTRFESIRNEFHLAYPSDTEKPSPTVPTAPR